MFAHLVLVFSLFCAFISASALAQMPQWSYDAGPDLTTMMGRELLDITADIPNMPEISDKIMGRSQKFRPAFGPIPWRMRQEANKVKILFIGQDGTHIAEAAGRPATAGFGGRAQDFANYFGVNEGAAFINAYSFTIKGQYGIYNTPYIYEDDGEQTVRSANLVGNDLWLMSNSLQSPVTKWRNRLIDWIIRNNKKSIKLVVLFGGAARDAIATYAKSKGAEVYGRYEKLMSKIQVPLTKSEYAGGNNTFPSLVAQDGGDLYEDVLGRKLTYRNSSDQKAALQTLRDNLQTYLKKAVFTKGGPYKNGLLNAAQLGGYDLDTMKVNGIETRSLKGIQLDDGTILDEDVIVISLPHPSYLSRTVMDADSYTEGKKKASALVMRDVQLLDKFKVRGWRIEPDLNKVNFYDRGEDYEYGRSDIGPEFYDFGTPENRMVSRSTAKRMSRNANVVIIGTRDNGKFSSSEIKKMTQAKPAPGINPESLFIARPSAMPEKEQFDPGPGLDMAREMIVNLDQKALFKTKEGMSFEKDGIDAYYVKSHPDVGDFGHYRGTFNNPKIIVLADPSGYDDLITARALTGTRGQYLQGMLNEMGVKDDYLLLKTVPVAMDGATSEEWKYVLEKTNKYRERVLKRVMRSADPILVIADGEYAIAEAKRLLKKEGLPIIKLRRTKADLSLDVTAAQEQLAVFNSFSDVQLSGKMANIPRTHLSFYSRVWEGTSGDRVITSEGTKYKGLAFAEVVPSWAYNQKKELSAENQKAIQEMLNTLEEQGLPLPYEKVPRYLDRTQIDPSYDFNEVLEDWKIAS
ncbi:MAG: hypothetical protein CME62_07850 [Halobacteriovoraceae bacterium]|nr:hypothetical protein [Halobacteriovoraceae bacterium]|tara:strand:- start:1493 stop:3898 length:2406 start_codon:yes stop_codon:yes gene_type:complete